ncbi:MAG TPA: hypothetical protein VFQ07_16055, partial [Candidatus Polarisedimenticolia bacterium]|nr:hypothetical protein [Candidatus Polarisedimenticolia bacterium]
MCRLKAGRLLAALILSFPFGIPICAAAQPPARAAAAPGEVGRVSAAPSSLFMWTAVTTANS